MKYLFYFFNFILLINKDKWTFPFKINYTLKEKNNFFHMELNYRILISSKVLASCSFSPIFNL